MCLVDPRLTQKLDLFLMFGNLIAKGYVSILDPKKHLSHLYKDQIIEPWVDEFGQKWFWEPPLLEWIQDEFGATVPEEEYTPKKLLTYWAAQALNENVIFRETCNSLIRNRTKLIETLLEASSNVTIDILLSQKLNLPLLSSSEIGDLYSTYLGKKRLDTLKASDVVRKIFSLEGIPMLSSSFLNEKDLLFILNHKYIRHFRSHIWDFIKGKGSAETVKQHLIDVHDLLIDRLSSKSIKFGKFGLSVFSSIPLSLFKTLNPFIDALVSEAKDLYLDKIVDGVLVKREDIKWLFFVHDIKRYLTEKRRM